MNNVDKNNLSPLAIIVLGLVVAGVIVGGRYYRTAADEKVEQEQSLAETQKQKDVELETLKQEVESLKQQPPTIIREVPQAISKSENSDYSAIVTEWQDRVARVDCLWKDSNGKVTQTAQGSGVLVNLTGIGTSLITNQHVVLGDFEGGKYVANGCVVGIFGIGSRMVEYAVNNSPFVLGGNLDWAYIKLGSEYNVGAVRGFSDKGMFDETVSKHLNACTSNVNIGDKLIVLGYPAIGTQGGITVTEGIVSGIEDEDYVTSAKIDHGNSGGAAILLKDDCYLGIPTWAAHMEGGFESLGRILKASFVVGN